MEDHPFRRAWETRDLDAWMGALAEDVVLRSPVITAPFTGKVAARELYGVLFDVFGRVEITHEFTGSVDDAFFWRGEIGGRTIEGTDLMRHDADGRIAEITVCIRPLVGIGTFAGASGPPLARRRGPVRAVILRVLTAPLRAMLAAVDVLAPRLAQRR